MTLAAIALVLPAAYYHSQYPSHKPFFDGAGSSIAYGAKLPEDTHRGLMVISHGTAVLLLIVYIAYLFFEVFSLLTSNVFHLYAQNRSAQNPCVCFQECE
jgi:Ca2+:H+ antiporter